MKVRVAVRIVIPVLILLFGLSLIVMQYIVSYRFDRNAIHEEANSHARLVRSQIIQAIDKQLELKSLSELNDQLRSLKSILSDLEIAVVVDESDMVVASSDSQWIKVPLSELPELSQIASQIISTNQIDGVLGKIDKNHRMYGVFPIELASGNGPRTQSDISLIGVVLNQQNVMQIMREKRLAIAIYSALLLALIMILLWFFMSRFLVLPLQSLISTVRSFAKGDFTVSANLTQENELGEISLLLDSLATINKAREKAEESRNRLAQIVEESVNEIYITDAENYRILDANRAARKNLGYSLEECQTLMPWDIVESVTEQNVSLLTRALRNGDISFLDIDTVQRRKDGSRYPVHAVLQFMATQTPPVYTAIVQDITERKLQEQNVQLRDRAIEELDVGVSILDATIPGRPIVYVNRRLCEMTGFSADQLLGNSPEILRDEELNDVELRKMYIAIASGEPVQGLLNYKRQDGTDYIGDLSMSPVHSAEGELTHYIAIVRDVTERLDTEARLNRSQKIEAIGQLAGGVAHDFNNLLSVIIGNIEFLRLSISDEKHRSLLDKADVAAQMGARLTRKLLSFAKQDQLEPVVLDANEQVREAMSLLRTTIGENYELTFALAKDLWRIRADPSSIENAVINLSLNARDAMPEGGQILIETCNVSLNGGDDSKLLDVLPGDYIQLSVSDTGFGMTREVMERIFEPFFTTKDVGENSGLGLASTYGFAQQSGGNVLVDSRVGSGAVISLLLPRHDDRNDVPVPTDISSISLAARCSRVLVVEDDEMVRDVTVARLHALGYLTTQAANGPEAIHLLQQNEHFDLVLTDLVMDGGMSGFDVADWVQQNHPECKVLLTSGYSEDRVQDGHSTVVTPPLLQKPYKLADLQAAMSALLADD